MIDINELRRLAQAATPGPWHATKSVETNSWAVWSDTTRLMELRPTKTVDMYQVSNTAAFIAAVNPAAISELIDRLEEAESALFNLGVTPEEAKEGLARHKATLARLEAAEDELETERMRLAACGVAALGYFEGCAKKYTSASLDDVLNLRKQLEVAEKERDALRAKLEEMEKQEPVAWTTQLALELGSSALGFNACRGNLWGDKGVALYTLPGAKGEEK